jgi:hypothetical protein
MKKNFGYLFALAAVLGGALLAGGCVVDDDVDGVDDDPDTTIVNPPAPDGPDVNVTPPAGGSVEIDR